MTGERRTKTRHAGASRAGCTAAVPVQQPEQAGTGLRLGGGGGKVAALGL